jgi:hypothetical protein
MWLDSPPWFRRRPWLAFHLLCGFFRLLNSVASVSMVPS